MSKNLPIIALALIITNVLLFLIPHIANVNELPQGALYYLQNEKFAYTQWLSHFFLHGSVSHLAFNMLGLWFFGRTLEFIWGKWRFLFFYLLCALGAAAIHLLITHLQLYFYTQKLLDAGVSLVATEQVKQLGADISPFFNNVTRENLETIYLLYHTRIIGASGAIYGLLVAHAYWFPNHKLVFLFLPFPIAAKWFVPILLTIDLILGISNISLFGNNIAHFAHIGGAILGFILIVFWLTPKKRYHPL